MANLEKFTRYRDNPTLKEPGTSPVATSIEQLEKMTLEERQRVVASIEVLTKYSAKLKDEVAKLAGQLSSADLDKIKAGLEDSLAGRVDEVLKKIEQEERSLDIKNLWFGIQSNAPEIRWEKPNWNKPYEVEIYISLADSTDLASVTLQYTVKSPKNYHIFSDNIEGKYIFVRAKDKETGTYGNFSPVVRVEDRDVRLAKFLEYIQGKIKVTALDEKLIAALKEDIHQATQQQIEDELGRVRSEVETTKGQIQNTINAVRESSEQSWSQLRDTVLRNGTNISNIQRKADGLTEEIKTISAKADNAVAGVENINTVIAEKDSAVRREIQNAITQVESTKTEVKRELIQTATNLESKLTAEKDARTQLGNNLARTTEKVDQLATESDSLKRKTTQIETDVAGNKTKTQQLEENISNLDSSTTKKLESIKSSFNNDHFYNYNMSGGTDGWMLEDFNQDITAKVNTDVGPEDLRYPNLLTSIVNTGNIFVKSTQVKPIEREKTYRLTATFKTRSTQANLKEANLYFLPFDKNGNKHRPQDGLLNRQGGAKYPLIQAKTEVQPNGWVTLTGEISTWSSSYPITTAAEANMIPLPTVFACPALELVGKQDAGSFEVDIAVLDLKDISDEKSVTSQIDTVKRTLSDENKALAQQFTSQTSQFKSDITAQMTQLSKSVTDAQKASNTRIDDMGTRIGASESKIQGLEQTINDEKSSNALKIDTLRADFNKSKANQIDFDLDKTPTFESYPTTKFRIIDKSAATLISRDFVATYPANKYLKFWGVSLSFKQSNKLPVKPGDRLYASAELFSKSVDTFLYVRYTDENDKYVRGGVAKLVGHVGKGRLAKIENADLIVPNDPKVKYAHISVDTSKPTLSEENDPILISNPQLRHYDETAIRADAKLNDLKIAVSSEVQSYAERTQGIESELNGRLAQNNIKQTARAEADEVATSKVETAKSELKDSISNIQNAQTTLSNTVKAQAEELKTVKSDYKSDIAKANSRIDSTNTTLNDKYSSLSSKTDTLESNYRALDDKYTQSEARNKAERVALSSKDEALTRRLDEQSTKIQGAETKISTLENTQTNDRQAFTNFKRDTESKLNDSSSKISKLEKTTTDLSNTIAETSKSLKSEFSNDLDSTKTELKDKIDNLKIGTRNYLNDANFKRNKWKFTRSGNSQATYEVVNDTVTITIPSKPAGEFWNQWQVEGNESGRLSLIEDGAEITISFEAMSEDTVKPSVQISFIADRNNNLPPTSPIRYSTNNLTNRWTRYSVKGIVQKPSDFKHWRFILACNDSGTIKFRRPQVELGNVVSDFRIAPEDIETNWIELKDKQDLNNLVETGNYFISRTNNINSPITGYVYLTVDAVKSDKIKQTVQADNKATESYIRIKNGDTWSDWIKIASSVDLANVGVELTKANSKIDQNERTISDKYRTLAERTTTLESKANTVDGRIISAIISERTNTEATASRVATEKSSELKVQFDARMISDQNNLLAYTDTMNWYLHKDGSEPQPQTVEEGNAATLRGDTTNWKHAFQPSKEGDKSNDPKASLALTQIQPDLPYVLTFEARSNIAGNVINPMLRLYYKDADNAKQSRNSNVPSIPLVDEWRSYQVILTAPSLKANEARNYFACLFEMKSTGTIQVRNPRLAYDAKTAIERINASITETKQLAVDASGKVRAKIGLKVNANGKAVGWSSEVNGDTNNFSINADNFKIANGADDYTPFSIDTTNKKIKFNGEVSFNKGTNLLINPIMSSTEIGTANDYWIPLTSVPGWKFNSTPNGRVAYFEARSRNSDWSPDVEFLPGELCLNIRNDNKTPRDQERTGILYQDLSVTPGSWYIFSAWIASHGSQCRVLVEEIDKDGRFVRSLGGSDWTQVRGGRDLNNYKRAFVKFKATSPNVRLALEQSNVANESTTSVLQSFIFRPMLEECGELSSGPSAWSNSASGTVIDGDQLKTSLIRVGNGVNLLKNPGLWRDSNYKNSYENSTWDVKAPYGWQDGYIGDSQNMCMSWHNSTRDASYKGGQGLPDRCDVIQLASGRTTAQMGWTIAMSQYLWLTPGRTYIYSIQGALYGSASGCMVERYNPTGGFISRYGVIPLEQARSVENVNAMKWDRKWVKFTIPADHEGYVRVFIGLLSAGDRNYSDGYFFRPMLEEVPIHQNEPSPWSDSATLITPNSVATNSLSALSANMGHISAGSMNINGRAGINSDGHLWANGANINGQITATSGSIRGVLQVGDDWNNGVRIHGDGERCIVVVEGGHIKVRLGKL